MGRGFVLVLLTLSVLMSSAYSRTTVRVRTPLPQQLPPTVGVDQQRASTAVRPEQEYPLNVRTFGAVGDGITDDTEAIQTAVDAMSSGGSLHFPPGRYAISDTIHFGRWSIRSANNDVLGFAMCKHGYIISGGANPMPNGTACILWIGAAQAGDQLVTCRDSIGVFPIIRNAKPMFSILNGMGVTLENLVFDGNGKAFVGVQYDGRCEMAQTRGCRFRQCHIGLRHGVGWDPVRNTVYWGYAGSPYLRKHVFDAPSYGGWSLAQNLITACAFENNRIGYSCESAQALNVVFQTCSWSTNSCAHMLNQGGRITLIGSSFNGPCCYDVVHTTSGCLMTFVEHHIESTPEVAGFQSSTVASSGPKLCFINSEFTNSIHINCGGAKISANNSNLGEISRTSDSDSEFYVMLENTTVNKINLVSTAYPTKIHVGGMNVKVNGTSLLAGDGAYQCERAIFNVYPPSAYVVSKSEGTRSVVEIATDYTVVSAIDNGKVFTNANASNTVEVQLAAAVPGWTCRFIRTASYPFQITPETMDCFRGHGPGKHLELDSDGDSVTIQCLTTGVWDIIAAYDSGRENSLFSWEP